MNYKFFWQQMFQKEGIMIRIIEQKQGLSKGVITYIIIENEEGKKEIHFNNGEKYVLEEYDGEKQLIKEGQTHGPLHLKIQTLHAVEEQQKQTSDDMELVFTVFDDNQKQCYLGTLTEQDIYKQDKKVDIDSVINQIKKYGNNFLPGNEYLTLKQIDENYQISMKIEEEVKFQILNKTKKYIINLTVKLEKQNQVPEKFIKQEINPYKETQILDQTQRQINNLKTKLSIQFQDQMDHLDKKFQEQIQQVQKALSDQIQNSNQQQEQQFQTLNRQVCTIYLRLFKPLQSLQKIQPQKQQEIQHYILNESDASFEEDIIKLKEDLQKTKDEDINQQANQIEQIKKTLKNLEQSIQKLNPPVEYLIYYKQELDNKINHLSLIIQGLQDDQKTNIRSLFQTNQSLLFQSQQDLEKRIQKLEEHKNKIMTNPQPSPFTPAQQDSKSSQIKFIPNSQPQNYQEYLNQQLIQALNKIVKDLEAKIKSQERNLQLRINQLENMQHQLIQQLKDQRTLIQSFVQEPQKQIGQQQGKQQETKLTYVQIDQFQLQQQNVCQGNLYLTPIQNNPQTELQFTVDDEDAKYSIGILEEGNLEYSDIKFRAYIFDFPDGNLRRGAEDALRFLPRQILRNDKFGIKVDRSQGKLIVSLNGQELPSVNLKEDFGQFTFVFKSEKELQEVFSLDQSN